MPFAVPYDDAIFELAAAINDSVTAISVVANTVIPPGTDTIFAVLITKESYGEKGIGTTETKELVTITNVAGVGNVDFTVTRGASPVAFSAGDVLQVGFRAAWLDEIHTEINNLSTGNVDGSGTANAVPLWSDSDTLADSIITESGAVITVTGSLTTTVDVSAVNITATGVVSIDDGTEVLPGLALTSDASSGLWADPGSLIEFAISTQGVQRYRVNNFGHSYISNGDLFIERASIAGAVLATVSNTDTGATSHAILRVQTGMSGESRIQFYDAVGIRASITSTASDDLIFDTGGTTVALTIDSSQDAVFAANLDAASIGTGTPGTGAFSTLSTSGLATLASASVTANLDAATIGTGTPGTGAFTTLSTTLDLTVGAGTDRTVTLGRGEITSFAAGFVYFAHVDQATTANYGIRLSALGRTTINSVTGDSVRLAINNVVQFICDATNITIGTNNLVVTGGDLTLTNGDAQITNGNLSVGGAAPTNLGAGNIAAIGGVLVMSETTTPTADAGIGKVYPKSDNVLYFQDGAGVEHPIGGATESILSYSFVSSAADTYYVGGYYQAPVADSNLTQAGTTQTLGSANISYGAHAFIVAGGAGTATGGSGAVTITVSGTTITDAGVRATGQTVTLVADITAMSTDDYFETPEMWIGQPTYTLEVGATGHTAFAADFNYGFAKYDDRANMDFTVRSVDVTGTGGATDSGFNVSLCRHAATGWTYHATAFEPGIPPIADMNTDHSTESNLAANNDFAWKRTNLNTVISGSTAEGILIRIVTAANNSVSDMAIHVGIEM